MKKIVLFIIVILNLIFVQTIAFAVEQNTAQHYSKKLELISNGLIFDKSYINEIHTKVESNWNIPIDKTEKYTVVIGYLKKDGTLESAAVVTSSKDEEFDQRALDAVNKSFPLKKKSKIKETKPLVIRFCFGTDPNVNFKPYLKKIQKKIKSNWHPKHSTQSKKIAVLFKINKDGSLENLKIYKSSGEDDLDQEALNAVTRSKPFDPLPKEFHGKSVDIQFTFDYHVWKLKNN